jgi:hypothetical protein
MLSLPSAVATHVAVLNNREMYEQILGNWIVQAKPKWEDEGFLCLMIICGRLAGRALIVVVDVYYDNVSSYVIYARERRLTMWSHEPTAHKSQSKCCA